MLRKTKIVCTLGPSTDQGDVLKNLMLRGMNVARFNFSHQTHEEHQKRFETVVRLREQLELPVATLLDTKGPEVRLGLFEKGKVSLTKDQDFTLYTKETLGNEQGVSVTHKDLPLDVSIGNRILLDDGLIEMQVKEKGSDYVTCRVCNSGEIANQKGVNLPDCHLSLPFVSEKDRDDILFGASLGFDFIAASFTRTASDILEVRAILEQAGYPECKLIAKIENMQGVENIDEIIKVSDGIMVARGDMGVEIPFEQLPAIQKSLIKKAYLAGKPVITATQMLESMMVNPRPTRAEISDVANAIYDETSAVMLSGETAAGEWPVHSCETMDRIARQVESDIHYKKRFAFREFQEEGETRSSSVSNAISKATVTTAHALEASAILSVTLTGMTAGSISKLYPKVPIVAGTTSKRVCRQLNLLWGVYPVLLAQQQTPDDVFDHLIEAAKWNGFVQDGDLVVLTAGMPLGLPGTTNMLKVQTVGEKLFHKQPEPPVK